MEKPLLSYLKLYKDIPETDQQVISDAFSAETYKNGDDLLVAGKIADKLFFINKGILKITVPDQEEERDLIYYLLKEHQLMSFLYSLYGNSPAEQGLQAASDVEVLVIDKEGLFNLFEQLPYFKELLSEIWHLSMVNMIGTKNLYLSGSAAKRYDLFLKHQPEIALYAAQIDIASYLGITPQSLSRIRKLIGKR